MESHLKMMKSFDGNALKNLAIEFNPKVSGTGDKPKQDGSAAMLAISRRFVTGARTSCYS